MLYNNSFFFPYSLGDEGPALQTCSAFSELLPGQLRKGKNWSNQQRSMKGCLSSGQKVVLIHVRIEDS